MKFDEVRRVALALPGVEEGTSYGTPAFRVRGKFFARLREDGESLVLKCNLFERQFLVDDLPAVFYITDHYRDYPAVLVRIPAVTPELLRERMEASWRIVAPKKLIAELDERAG
ncbi:MAG TPA: MmcQ/YjbR family DNA-binding protein [Longimicrobium sp.]|nr:MmcQ/YjbR family DNA-binding protein [Longimicrobium sp.]